MKGGSLKKSPRFVDQLQRYGLNTAKELAKGLMAMTPTARFDELRKLLPYLIPKLKEIDPILDDSPDLDSPVSTEQLLEAMQGNGRKSKPAKQGTSSIPTMEEGRSSVQVAPSTEEHLPKVDGEQKPD